MKSSVPATTLVRVGLGTLAVAAGVATCAVAAGGAPTIPAPANAARVIARDTYQRSVASGLGSAEIGGRYSVWASRGERVRVQAGAAAVTGLAPGRSFEAQLLSAKATDTAVSVTLTVPSNAANSAGFYFAVDLRRQHTRVMYRAKVKIARNRVGLRLAYVAAGVDRTLASRDLDLAVRPSDQLVLQAEVLGSDSPLLMARAWKNGAAEPRWQLQYRDGSRSRIGHAGSVGTWAYESNRGSTATFAQSNLSGWSVGPAATSTTPTAPSTGATASLPIPSAASPSASTSPSSSSPSSTGKGNAASSSPAAPPSLSPGQSGTRGAAAVGTTHYLVPSGALFVSPTAGSDANRGSLDSPLRTVVAAVSRAAPGQTIVLRAGIYHESVVVPAAKPGITIQSYPGEAVWFDGTSSVSGWTRSGNTWTHGGWNVQFDHSASFAAGQNAPNGWEFVGPQNPMAAWPDGVWLDGVQLAQVASASAVSAGTFYVDYSNHQLVIGNDPSGHEVHASDLAQAFLVLAPHVTLQGVGVRRYATPLPMMGTVRMQGGWDTLRDVFVTQNATQGISFNQSDNLAEHVTSSDNGMTGIHASTADRLTVRDSVISGNNAQLFNPEPAAAGIKITKSRGFVFDNNLFQGNLATGVWLDQADVGFTIVNSTFSDNTIGAELELADTGIFANNIVNGGKFGLYVLDTGNVKVYNNSFTNNPVGSIFMSQDARRQSNAYYYSIEGDHRYPCGDPTDPWLLRNIVVSNNEVLRSAGGGMFQVYALDKATHISADQMNVTITGNRFTYRDVSSQPTMVGWGGSDNQTVVRYETPTALAAAKNRSWRNLQTGGPATMAPQLSDEQSIAAPLPADVAAATGEPVGARRIGPF